MSSDIKYICFFENCREGFQTDSQIKFHLRNVHSLGSNDHYKCCVPFCNQPFSSFKNLSRHMKAHFTYSEITRPALDEIRLNMREPESIQIVPSTSIMDNELILNDIVERSIIPSMSATMLEPTLFSETSCEAKDCLFFTAKYISRNNITRVDILNIQEDIKKCITSHIGTIVRNDIFKLKMGSISNKELIASLEDILDLCDNPFKDINTEYKFVQYMEKKDLFRKPKDVLLSENIVPMVENYENTLSSKAIHVNIQDLEFQFRKFFELPEILEETLKNMNDLRQNGDINNFINGALFKKITRRYSENDTIIPFFLYWDDFEINNPLGSHFCSILGIYYSFPTLPSKYLSKVENIFVAAFIRTQDVKNDSDTKFFQPIVDAFIKLAEQGVQIKIGKKI